MFFQKKSIKPRFHLTGERGWINDPNGLIKFKGNYHAFYQYYPYDIHWGPMHWGHAISEDLLHWRQLPIALTPGDVSDKNGCFSGTALIHENKLYLLYTGYIENQGGETIRQQQCLASSEDGIHFEKHGVVIGEQDLPKGYAPCDFRDPKCWKSNQTFYCLVAARKMEGTGRILLYKSLDLFHWKFVGDIFNQDCKGNMIECPDYNEQLGVLLYSEQNQPREGNIHLNLHTTRWHQGKLDLDQGIFQSLNQGIIDYGFDFYASQFFTGESIMMGWLSMWDRNYPNKNYGFAGMLTIPRKVELRNNRLYQTPILQGTLIREYQNKFSIEDVLKNGYLLLKLKNLTSFSLQLRKKGNHSFHFYLDKDTWFFNSKHCGKLISGKEKDEFSKEGIRCMPYLKEEITEIIVVSDEFSLEIFINGNAASFQIYPQHKADKLLLECNSEECNYQNYKID